MRAYELMVIVEGEVDDTGVESVISAVQEQITTDGGTVAKTENWGKRKFAFPIDKKLEGTYVVFEIATPSAGLGPAERYLRFADEVVRHKVVRLPDSEATRRGLLTDAAAG
jgi:small subunit ribosomal protein S6